MGAFDARLQDWRHLSSEHWPTLLLGNGFSTNLWAPFGYQSLFDEADLDQPARRVFTALETSNFETALECLHHGRISLRALDEPVDRIETLYGRVRDSLFRTVSAVHVRAVPPATHRTIATCLSRHRSVFTTNYDLTLYWATRRVRSGPPVLDYFFRRAGRDLLFEPTHAAFRGGEGTRLHYLHGALHLWQDDDGRDGKWTNAERGHLLDLGDDAASSRRPLFVSEGTAAGKDSRIRRSPYLSFCRDRLAADEAATVVLGHSLSSADRHVAEAINAGARRPIAVSVWRGGGQRAVEHFMHHVVELLPDQDVVFFDSTTHPLGARSMTIPPPAQSES